MKTQRIIDNLLYDQPSVSWTGKSLQLNARVLTPARFSFAQHVVVYPLTVLWRCAFFVLLVDAVLTLAGKWTVFAHVPVGRIPAWGAVGGVWLLWIFETMSGYLLIKAIFGRTLVLEVDGENLTVGRSFFGKRYSREKHLTFRTRQFDFAVDPVYQRSQSIDLLVDETLWIPVVEVFGWKDAARVVTNANRMIELAENADSAQDGFRA